MTATPAPTNDVPTSRVDRHTEDDSGPFHRVVCTCSWASREFTGPTSGVTAEYAKALHDQAHEDEWRAAS